MMNIKRLTALTMAALLATTTFLTGCSKKTEVVETIVANKDDLSEAYKNTVFVVVSEKEQATVEATSVEMTKTPATENSTEESAVEIDVKDCGDFNTVSGQFAIPEIKVSEDITYISPVVSNAEIKSVKFVEELKEEAELGSAEDTTAEDVTEEVSKVASTESTEDYVKETTVTVDGKEVNAFNLTHAGIYEMEIGTDTVTVTVKNGSIFDDMLAGNAVKNIIVNTESKEFMELAKEYEDALPALIAQYLSQYDSEEEAIKAFENGNADLLKEFNRIRKLKGEEALSATDIVATYKPEDVEAANEKAESATSMRGVNDKVTEMNNENDNGYENTEELAYHAFALINAFRVTNGVERLEWSASDAAIAAIRAKELVSDFSHNSISGSKTHGENIALTTISSPMNVVNAWISSPGHRANILRSSFATAGLAVVYENGMYYWSNNFSYPDSSLGNNTVSNNETTSPGTENIEQQEQPQRPGIVDEDGWMDGYFEDSNSTATIVYADGEETVLFSAFSVNSVDLNRIPEGNDSVEVKIKIIAKSKEPFYSMLYGTSIRVYRDGSVEDEDGILNFAGIPNLSCKILWNKSGKRGFPFKL